MPASTSRLVRPCERAYTVCVYALSAGWRGTSDGDLLDGGHGQAVRLASASLNWMSLMDQPISSRLVKGSSTPTT